MSVISLSSEDEDEIITFISPSKNRTSYPVEEVVRFEHEDQRNPEEAETDPFMDDGLEDNVEEILPEIKDDDSAAVLEVDLSKILLAEQNSRIAASEEIDQANEISAPEVENDIDPMNTEKQIVSNNISATDSTQKISKLQLLAIQLAETMANNCDPPIDSSNSFSCSSKLSDSKMSEEKCHHQPILDSVKPVHSLSTDCSTDSNLMENSNNEGNYVHNPVKNVQKTISKDVNVGVAKKKPGRKKGWRKPVLIEPTQNETGVISKTEKKPVKDSYQIDTPKKRGRRKGWRKNPKLGETTVERSENAMITREIETGLNSTPEDILPVNDLYKLNVPKKPGRQKGQQKYSKTNESVTVVNNNNNNKINCTVLKSEIETTNLNDHYVTGTDKGGVTSNTSQGQEGTIHSNSNKKTSPEKYKSGWKKRLLQREGIFGSVKLELNEGNRKRKNKCLDIASLGSIQDSDDMIGDENKKIKYLVDNKSLNVHVNIQVTEVRSKIKSKGNQVSPLENECISKRKKVHRRKKVSFENSNNESTNRKVPTKELFKTDLVNKEHSANETVLNIVSDFVEEGINRKNSKVESNVNEPSNNANCDQSSPLDGFSSYLNPKSLTHESLDSSNAAENTIPNKLVDTSKFTEGDSIFNDDLFRFMHYDCGDNINERVNAKDPMPSSIKMDLENIPCPGRDYVHSYNIVYDDNEEYTCMEMGDILHLSLNEFVNLKMRLDTTSKLSCEKLKSKEVYSALQYYRESYSHYKKTFQNLFSNIYDKIFNNPIIIESFNKYRRVLLLTWFNKLYLRVVTLSPDFNESLENMRTYIMSGLLSNVHLQYPFVEQVFAIGASEFEKECWVVLGLMQDCYKDDVDVEPSTTDSASTENNTEGLEDANGESIGNNANVPLTEKMHSAQTSQDEFMSNVDKSSDQIPLNSTSTSNNPKEKCMQNLPNQNLNTNICFESKEGGQAITANVSLNNYPPSLENTNRTEDLQPSRSTVIHGPIKESSFNKDSMPITDQPVNTPSIRTIQCRHGNNFQKIVVDNTNSTHLQSRCSVPTEHNDVYQVQRPDWNNLHNRCVATRGGKSSNHTMPNILSNILARNAQSTYLDSHSTGPTASNTTPSYNKGIRVVDTRDLMDKQRINNVVVDSNNRNGRNSKQRKPTQQMRPTIAVPNTIPPRNVVLPSYADHVRRYRATTSDGYFQRRYDPNMYTNYPNQYQYHYSPRSVPYQRPSLQGHYLTGQNINFPQSTNPPMSNSAGGTPSANYSGLTRKEIYMRHYLQSLYGSDLYRQFVNSQQAQYQYGPSAQTNSHQIMGQDMRTNGAPPINSASRHSQIHALDYSHVANNPGLPYHPGLPVVSVNGTPSAPATTTNTFTSAIPTTT